MAEKKKKGFATMDPEKQREIARKGGKTVSSNSQHMADIGRKGGERVSLNLEHMAEIGRKGGTTAGKNRTARAKKKDSDE